MLGLPVRLVVTPRTLQAQSLEVKARTATAAALVPAVVSSKNSRKPYLHNNEVGVPPHRRYSLAWKSHSHR